MLQMFWFKLRCEDLLLLQNMDFKTILYDLLTPFGF